jgi:sphinganine-1-phosphate aldolase
VVMHRDRASRRRQTFVFDGWLGGAYASSGMLGTKPGGPIAAAWASLHFLGRAGFRAASRQAFEARQTLEAGVRAIPGLTVLGRPDVTLMAIAADDSSDVDVFNVMDELDRRGWLLDRQGPPDSLHATVMPAHNGEPVESFLADLRAAVADLRGATTDDRSTRYATLD